MDAGIDKPQKRISDLEEDDGLYALVQKLRDIERNMREEQSPHLGVEERQLLDLVSELETMSVACQRSLATPLWVLEFAPLCLPAKAMGCFEWLSAPAYWNTQLTQDCTANCHVCKSCFQREDLRHCRNCGNWVCSPHSQTKKKVPWKGWADPVRICDSCKVSVSIKHEALTWKQQIECQQHRLLEQQQVSSTTSPKGKGKGTPPTAQAPTGKAPPITKANDVNRCALRVPRSNSDHGLSRSNSDHGTFWQKADGDWATLGPSEVQECERLFAARHSTPIPIRRNSWSSGLTNIPCQVVPHDIASKIAIVINAKGANKLPPAEDLMKSLEKHSCPVGTHEAAELLERASQLHRLIKQVSSGDIRKIQAIERSEIHSYRDVEQCIFHLLPVGRFSDLMQIWSSSHLVESAKGGELMQHFKIAECAFEQLYEASAEGQSLRQVLLIVKEALDLVGGKWATQQFTWKCLAEADEIREPAPQKAYTKRKKLLDWLASKHVALFNELIQVLPALDQSEFKPLDVIQGDLQKISEAVAQMEETGDQAIAEQQVICLSGKDIVQKLMDQERRTLDLGRSLLQRLGEKPQELSPAELRNRLDACLRLFVSFVKNVKAAQRSLSSRESPKRPSLRRGSPRRGTKQPDQDMALAGYGNLMEG
eukprot:gnl/MRDRNA2_/MRDRNA2_27510_c0_seq1.p1 gnl/MRDRNA2_/MRDRNA2_27510_c0~~gnl/MRDRNA2_/MRDRNA2_27510_c0_seq1.p1  ORF type:complete len:652 (+),score=137.22 gnl/MRDRNA2_/MRDRNA2_27510_c0_seq1:73-2028(+)